MAGKSEILALLNKVSGDDPAMQAADMPKTTELPAKDEKKYKEWMNKQGFTSEKGFNVDDKLNGTDYDYRGFWKETGGKSLKEGEHLPDTYKLPNHPTFSNESKYANSDNKNWQGQWNSGIGGERFVPFNTGYKKEVTEPSGKKRQGEGAGGNGDENPMKIDHKTALDLEKPLSDTVPNNVLEVFKKLYNVTDKGVKYEYPPFALGSYVDEKGVIQFPKETQKEAGLRINSLFGAAYGEGNLPTEKELFQKSVGGSTAQKDLFGTVLHNHPFPIDPSPQDLKTSDNNYPNYELDSRGINLYDESGVKKRWDWKGITYKNNDDMKKEETKNSFQPNLIELFNAINKGENPDSEGIVDKTKTKKAIQMLSSLHGLRAVQNPND